MIKASQRESHKNMVFSTFHNFTESRQLNLTWLTSTDPGPFTSHWASSSIFSLSLAICWAHVSFTLVVVAWTAGMLDTESLGITSTAISEPVVEHTVVDWLGGLWEQPGHLQAMWPFWWHLKQWPSFLNCICLLFISFANGAQVWVASTSMGTIPLLLEAVHGRFRCWVWPVWNGLWSRGFLLWKLRPTPIIFRTLWSSPHAASCHSAMVVGSVS